MTLSREASRVVRQVADALRDVRRVCFVTGAGISADSGLPTYRGVGGLYANGPTDDGLAIEEALSGSMLREHPELTWKYIAMIEASCRGARPNRGHEVIARFEESFEHVLVLTQNVDGFHRQAGSQNVIEIHGDLHDLVCSGCNHRQRHETYAALSIPPHCPDCDAILRPEVVLFGELLPTAAVSRLHDESERGFDMVFTIGTTSVFPYIAQPVLAARSRGVPTVEINPGTTVVSELVDHRIQAGAAASLDAIWRSYRESGARSD